jgi:tryptophan-rich sensory protein
MVSFVLMGLTLFLILESGIKQHDVSFGLILFIAQLIFTLAWAWAFFGAHLIFVAFLFMIALFATLLCAEIQVFRFSVYGGMLMVPYLLWVFYLAYLNYGIMTLNHLGLGF